MSIYQVNIYGEDKIQHAIERLKAFEPPEGYYLAFSGGKDSVVIKALADMAGVKYDAHYNHTSVDAPELIRFIKEKYPDVSIDFPRYKDGRRATMWNLIGERTYPPTRLVRYCCEYLKETQSDGRLTITGVRWAESANRRRNQGEVTIYGGKDIKQLRENENFTPTSKGGVILNNDNTESRDWIEHCYSRNKTVINPIIEWTDAEVWEFIKDYNIPYCKLYDEGFKRIGCIGCPMSTKNDAELERFPGIKKLYLMAFDKMLKNRQAKGLKTQWKNAQEVYDWWTETDPKKKQENKLDFAEWKEVNND